MRLVLQRVSRARVDVEGETVAAIGAGLLMLAGFGPEDDEGAPDTPVWKKMVRKVLELRIFPDNEGRLNRSLTDIGGQVLVVSQFTLYADCRKGRRPSFTGAASPETAAALYRRLVDDLEALHPQRVHQGVFGAAMDVDFCNRGPVTILMDSADFG